MCVTWHDDWWTQKGRDVNSLIHFALVLQGNSSRSRLHEESYSTQDQFASLDQMTDRRKMKVTWILWFTLHWSCRGIRVSSGCRNRVIPLRINFIHFWRCRRATTCKCRELMDSPDIDLAREFEYTQGARTGLIPLGLLIFNYAAA